MCADLRALVLGLLLLPLASSRRPPPPGKEQAPQTRFVYVRGALALGNDLLVAPLTLAQAEDRCRALPGCVGFTFWGNETAPTFPVTMRLKSVDDRVPGAEGWNAYVRAAPQVAVVVDPAAGHDVNPLIMGCHSDSGFVHQAQGLYAQMVYGESFEDLPGVAWNPWLLGGGDQGSASLDNGTAFHGLASMELSYPAGAPEGGRVGATNRGEENEGLYLRAGRAYEGYLFASAPPGADVAVEVSLRNHAAGTTLAAVTRTVAAGAGWVKLEFELNPSAECRCSFVSTREPGCGKMGKPGQGLGHACIRCDGEVAVALVSPGARVHVDYVYLQPGAWGRFAGLPVRADAVAAMRAMGVTAIRQGGSFASVTPDNGAYYQWQRWTGPPWSRNSTGAHWHGNLIGGFGPFEMVDLCNAAGIEPVITTTCSSTAESLADLLEYCWGDAAATPMGRRRAADGHPAPYRVRYFELGNEQYNAAFVPQVAAMEARAAELGMAGRVYYLFPDNSGITPADAARIVAAGIIPAENVLVDIHTKGRGGVGAAKSLFAKNPGFPQGAMNCETNANKHTLTRALMEADDLNQFLSEDMPRMHGRAASFCIERSGHFDGFDQGLAFYLPNMTWLQPPGMVHKMVADTWAATSLPATASGPMPLSVSAGLRRGPAPPPGGTGGGGGGAAVVVVRVVNPSPSPVRATFSLLLRKAGSDAPAAAAAAAAAVGPTVRVHRLSGPDLGAANPPFDPERVSPRVTVEPFDGALDLPGYSYTVAEFSLLPPPPVEEEGGGGEGGGGRGQL